MGTSLFLPSIANACACVHKTPTVYIHNTLSVCDYIRLSVCLYVCIDETVYVYIRLNVCIHIRLCMCVHIDSMYECVFMCKTVSICVLYKAVNEHACVCTCIHMFGFTYNV